MTHYHLAQINVARMLAPLDSPQMAPFVALLDPVNQMAERTPGFVWRLKTEEGNATAVQAFEDPMVIVNFTIWESVESLQEFAYKGAHTEPLRRRGEWFEKPTEAHQAMWWIPAGHIPTVHDARERLEFRRRNGDTPVAFSFARRFPAPEAPEGGSESQVSYDGRRFSVRVNSANGDCSAETLFHYRQSGSRVWATYEGGAVRFGSLVAVTDASGALDMRYHHVDRGDAFRTGRCYSRPEILENGRIRLHERWQWTNGDASAGETVVEELDA
jgi:hypothetical protein